MLDSNESLAPKTTIIPRIFFESNFDKLKTVLKDTVFGCHKICVVTDQNVEDIWGSAKDSFMSSISNKVSIYVCEPGEISKSFECACAIYKFLIDNKFSRSDFLLAFGGGVIGDLTGFVASTFMRGIRFIHVPTTLMSQIDSSIGGKTAINFGQQKNIIGTFAQPEFIYINTNVLKTLSTKEISDGMAEIMKYALLDKTLFDDLIENDNIFDKFVHEGNHEKIFLDVLKKCINIKLNIIERDQYDMSERKFLNFGHTFAHALESVLDFQITHGSAVSLGILFALYLSGKENKYAFDKFILPKTIHLLKLYNLPTQFERLDKNLIFDKMLMDKKCRDGKINLVLLNDIGNPILKDNLTKQQIFEAMDYVTCDK